MFRILLLSAALVAALADPPLRPIRAEQSREAPGCCGGGDPSNAPIGWHIDECCKMKWLNIEGEWFFGSHCIDCIVPASQWAECYVHRYNVIHVHPGTHLLHLRLKCNGAAYDDNPMDHVGVPPLKDSILERF